MGGDVLYIIFLAAVFIENISSVITDYLFPLLCHLLSCPSISDRQCAVQAQAWKKPLGGRWKDGNILNWCHHWIQHARKLKPQFWRISWSVDGVERQRDIAYFGGVCGVFFVCVWWCFFLLSPQSLGALWLNQPLDSWILFSFIFSFSSPLTSLRNTQSKFHLGIHLCNTSVVQDGWRDSILKWNTINVVLYDNVMFWKHLYSLVFKGLNASRINY